MKLIISNKYAFHFSLFVIFLLMPYSVYAVPPTVTTQSVSNISTTTATGNGNITSLGVPNPTAHGVVWNEQINGNSPTVGVNDGITNEFGTSATGPFTTAMTGLSSGTTYFVRAYAINNDGTVNEVYGAPVMFTTYALPVVTTQSVSNITTTTATGNGNLTSLGVPNPTAHGVVWNEQANGNSPTVGVNDGITNEFGASATGPFTTAMTGLSSGTTYFVRAYATNAAGTVYGAPVTFTANALPVVTTQPVSNIFTTTATGNGNIISLGVPNPISHGVVWNEQVNGNSPTVGDNDGITNELGASTVGPFTTAMTGLTSGTTYFVRAYATNINGTSYGAPVTFTAYALPVVTTQPVSNISTTTATGNGNIISLGVPNPTAHGMVWNLQINGNAPTVGDNDGITNELTASTTGPFTTAMTALTAGTTYYVRAYATNAAGTVYGTPVTFTTYALPVVTTQPVSNISTTTATGNGNILSLGVPNPTAHGVVWNLQINGSAPTVEFNDGSTNELAAIAIGAFTTTMTGLSPNTSYYVRSYATNTAGTTYGSTVPFMTQPQAPSVTTQPIINISTRTATGQGTIVILGAPTPTAHGVCWNTTQNPTLEDSINSTDEGATSNTGPFTSQMEDLEPNTRYYVRAYATNDVDTVYGSQESFITLPEPPVVVTETVTDVTRNDAIGHGRIDSVGIPALTQHGICWSGTVADPTIDDNDDCTELGPYSDTVPYSFESIISPLIPFNNYNMRAYATNSAGTVYGATQTFTSDPDAMVVGTGAITNIDQTTATGEGDITNLGIPASTQHGHCWNTAGAPTIADLITELGAPSELGLFTSELTGLTPGTTYYVRAYTTNSLTTVYGGEVAFTTLKPPTVTTLAASLIGDTIATGNGNIIDMGVPAPTAHGVCWNREGDPTLESSDGFTDEGAVLAIGPYSSAMTNLFPNTTYYVRAYATNSVGTFYGATDSFVTDPSASGVSTFDVTNIFTDSATANGVLSVLGEPPPTGHGFCWSTEPNPTIDDASDGNVNLGDYSGDVPYQFNYIMTDLVPGTFYYVRAYATGAAGTAYGNQVSFTTASDASSPRATLVDTPPGLTSSTVYNMRVGGIGIVAYRYMLNNGAWRQETNVDTPIEFTMDVEGMHTLAVLGKNTAGFWQPADNATQVSWVIDRTPPTAVLFNFPTGTVSTTDLEIYVGGSDVAYYRYRLDGAQWSDTYGVNRPITLSELSEGSYVLDVIGADQSFNWQSDSIATNIFWEIDLSVPTAVLGNFPETITTQTSASIAVSASPQGPDIESYVYTWDGGATWSEQIRIGTPIQTGEMDESQYRLCVNGFGNDTWQDGIDGSTLDSATCVEWRVDLTPPNAADLVVASGNPAASAVELAWTWDSDDLQEAVSQYRIWYATEPFDADTLNIATEIICNLTPGPQGFEEQFEVTDLQPGQIYYFAVGVIDVVGNSADLSNVANVTTADTLPVIDTIALTLGGQTADNSAPREITITGAQFLESEGSNIIRFENSTQVFDFYNKAKAGSSAGLIYADIPTGAPTGAFRARVINKNGISLTSSQSISINESVIPVPSVRSVLPAVVQTGGIAQLTVHGNHFDTPPAAVNLLSNQGVTTPLSNIAPVDETELTAELDVSDDFGEGCYGIQVINADSRANNVSATCLEIYQPINLDDSEGPLLTTKMVDLADLPQGMIPVRTTLTTDNRDEAPSVDRDQLSVSVQLEPGSLFEIYDSDTNGWNDFFGVVLPPRQIPATDSVLNTFGVNSVQFSMGANSQLRLKNNQTMFVIIEVVFPDNVSGIQVYYINPDGTRTLAGVDGAWLDMEIRQGGTILATQMNTPEEGKTTHTMGLLLTHMSDFAIGSVLPSDDSGSNDSYSACFVSSSLSSGTIPNDSRNVFYWLGGGFLMLVLGRSARRSVSMVLVITVIMLGFILSTPSVHAAEGAAAGAPQSESTETAPGIGVPTPLEEDQSTLEQLRKLEKNQEAFVPAAVSGVATESEPKASKPWYVHAGLGYTFIGSEISASLDGESVTNDTEASAYPILRGSYGLSDRFSIELTLSSDFYSGEVQNSISGDGSDMSGYTLSVSSTYYANEYTLRWIGDMRPLVFAGLGYRMIDSNLDYPVDGFKPALGFLIGTGFHKRNWEFRLIYGAFLHDAKGADSDYSSSDEQLDTSGIGLEISYRFNIF